MPRKSLRYGFKIALRCEVLTGFVLATNNVLLPLGVLPEKSDRLRFENAVFQLVTGDGDATADLTQRKLGEEVKFGSTIRLIHVNTNTLVCENKRIRATKEKVNQKVTLAAADSDEARNSKWRVLPRYKVRAEGENILDRDHIILQSLSGDTFLHVAPQADITSDNFYEVNCSTTSTGLTIQTYDTESTGQQARELRGGDSVQLFHKEERAFLVGDKTTKCFLEPEQVATGSALSMRAVDLAALQNSNSMFVIEFDDVFAGGLVAFGRKRMYRLKSLATGMYLCAELKDPNHRTAKPPTSQERPSEIPDEDEENLTVDEDIVVKLVEDPKERGTRICFHQATDETSSHCRNRSRVFLEFPLMKEGLWLGCGPPLKDMTRRRSTSAKLELDFSRPKKELVCSTVASHKDGIEVIKVATEEFQELNYVLALMPPIRRLIDVMKNKDFPTVQLVAQVRENITALAKLCTTSGEPDVLKREGTPVAKAQNRLMDQLVPQLCLSLVDHILAKGSFIDRDNIATLLVIPESEKQGSPGGMALKYADFLQLVRLCFRLIKLACFNNTRNACLMADSLETMFSYVEDPFGCIDTLSSIFLNNSKLVDTPDDLSVVERFTDLALKHRRNTSNYLRFLTILCVCNSIGIRNSQTFISEAIYEELKGGAPKVGDQEPLLLKLKLKKDKVYIEAPQSIGQSMSFSKRNRQSSPQTPTPTEAEELTTEIEIEDFCNIEVELGASPRMSSRGSFVSTQSAKHNTNTIVGYFTAQVELLAALAVGRNAENINRALEVIPPECIMPIIRNEDIPPSVRSVFFDLFRVTHLDVPPLEDKVEASRSLMHVWESQNQGPPSARPPTLPEQMQKIIDEMKDHLLVFFDHNKSMNPGDIAFNKCVLSAVMCATNIAKYGLLEPRNYVPWIKVLTPVLDGRDDREPEVDERYIKRFGKYSRYKFDEDNQIMMEVKLASMQLISVLAIFVISTKVLRQIHVFHHEDELPHLSTILDFRHDSTVDKASKEKAEELEDIKRKRENKNMLLAGLDAMKDGLGAGLGAMKGLGNLFGTKEEDPLDYLNELIDTLLDNALYEYHPVVCESLNLLTNILNVHHAMLQPLDNVQILSSSQGVEYYEKVKPIIGYLTRYCTSTIPKLEYPNVTQAITNLYDNLLISPSNIQPNTEKQGILKNMGAHQTISTIISSLASTSATKNLSIFATKLLEPAYRFLSLMVYNNPEAALDIFSHLENFVHHLPFHVGVQSLMARIFENNLDLCSSVSDTTIQDLIYAIPRTNNDPAVVHVLHMLVYQPGVVGSVQRNQASIMKYLLEAEESSPGLIKCRDSYTGHNGRPKRRDLLQQEDYLSEFSKVQYHLEILEIITHCCKAKDPAAASRRADVRYVMFGSSNGLEDILEVVCNTHLPDFYRSSYLKLFTELYLDERALRVPLLENKHFRTFLGKLQDDMLKMDQMLQELGAEFAGESARLEMKTTPSPTGSALNRKLQSAESYLEYFFSAVIPALKSITIMVGESGGDEEGGNNNEDLDGMAEIIDKLRDLAALSATCLQMALRNHPVQPVAEASVPGTVESPKKSGWFSNFRLPFGKKKDEDNEKQTKESADAMALQSLVPLRFRGASDFFFAEYDPFVDAAAQRELANVPFIPISDMKLLKDVVHLMINHDYKEGDPDTTEMLDSIDLYKLPRPEENTAETELTEDVKLFKRWKEFRKKFRESSNQAQGDEMFQEAARVMLRKGKVGHDAIRAIVRVLDSTAFSDAQRIVMIHLLRQIIVAEDEESTDASILIAENVELDIEDEGRKIETLKTLLTLDKELEERQNILAMWQGEYSLPPKIVQLIATDSRELLLATLQVGCDLLEGGNVKVQNCIFNWSLDRTDEDFFQQARHRLLLTREQVRERKRTLKRAIPDKQKRREKLPDEIHERLNRRYNFEMPKKLLKMIQLFCEGHYTNMQNYLREQEDNQVSINTLEPIISLLEMLVKTVDRETVEVTVQCLNTLTETYQGPCFGNQEFIISQNIGETVTNVMANNYGDITTEQAWELRMAAIILLSSLFEGHMNVQLVTTLISSLNMKVMVKIMDETYWEWAKEHGEGGDDNVFGAGLDMMSDLAKGMFSGLGTEDEFGDTLNLATNIFMFMKAALDIQGLTVGRNEEDTTHDHFMDKYDLSIKEAFRLSTSYRNLSEKIATIEIMRNGNIEKAYFRKPTLAVVNLHKESKEKLIDGVERGGHAARLSDFFERSFNLIHEMEFYEDMRKTPGLSIIHKYSALFEDLVLILSFTLNLFLLFSVHENNNQEFYLTPGKALEAFKALGIIQIVLQCMLFVNFFFGPCRIHLNESWMAWQDGLNEEAIKESKKSLSIEPPKFQPDAEKKLFIGRKILQTLLYIFTWYPFYERGLFVCVSFMGYYRQPMWYCLGALSIVGRSSQLQNVVRSVTQNGKNLLLTGCLLLVIIFIFAVVAFYNFSGDFDSDNTGTGGNCESLARCAMVMLVSGLKAGGGIADDLRPPVFGPLGNGYGYARQIYDFCFFAILITIGLNLVFGIILDTFGELREQRDFVTEDQTSKCFICGLEQADFDRVASGGFEQHIEFEHHMWDYLYFMHFVQLKPVDDHNGVEGYVFECMDAHEPKFYPIEKAMILESPEELQSKGHQVHPQEATGEKDADSKETEGDLSMSTSMSGLDGNFVEQFAAMKNQISQIEKMMQTLCARQTTNTGNQQ